MTKITCSVSMSLDGFVAGENMTRENPFGDAHPLLLHRWMFDEPEKHKPDPASPAGTRPMMNT